MCDIGAPPHPLQLPHQVSLSLLGNSHFGQDVPHNLPILILGDVRELGDREEKETKKMTSCQGRGALRGYGVPTARLSLCA